MILSVGGSENPMYLSKLSRIAWKRENENRNPDRIFDQGIFHTKTLLLLFILVIFVSGTASALTQGPLNCTPFPVTFMSGNGGPTPVSCPKFTPALNDVLTGVTLN